MTSLLPNRFRGCYMERPLRCSIVSISLAFAGCASQAPAPSPGVQTAIAQVELADTLHDAHLRAAHARAVAAGRAVDTIIVSPAEIRLRVGQSLGVEQFQVSALTAEREAVAAFAPVYVLLSPVARFTGRALEARAAGEAELFVEALPGAPPGVRPRPKPSTRVRIIVQP